MQTVRNAITLAALAVLGLGALPHAARAQTTVNGTYTTTDGSLDALDLFSNGNRAAGPSATPTQDPNNAYVFTGGTYSAVSINSALHTSGITATVNGGAFTGGANSLYLSGSTVTVNGGTFTRTNSSLTNVQSYDTNLSVYGGTFAQAGNGFFINGASTNTFYGDFAPQTIINTGSDLLSGMFSGTLVNGGPRQTFSYRLAQGGTLRLVNPNAVSTVPEPSSVAAFAFTGLGAAALILRARRRQAA